MVGRDHSRHGHFDCQPRLQPPWRRPSRCRGCTHGMSEAPLLTVRNLRVVYPGDDGDIRAVRNVSFSLGRERLGIVGESGSGKSTTGRAIMGLVGQPGRVEADELKLGDTDILGLDEKGFRRLRGKRVAMILQDPKYSLDPVMSVGHQIAEM